jgi:hypothetical protein
MTDTPTQLRVDGLTPLQLAELRAAIGAAGSDSITTLDTPNLEGGKVGEPTLLAAVITLGPSVIAAIALWISKQRKGRSRSLKYSRIDPNGGSESFELEESAFDEGESPAASIQAFLQRKLGNDAPAKG